MSSSKNKIKVIGKAIKVVEHDGLYDIVIIKEPLCCTDFNMHATTDPIMDTIDL